MGEALHNKYSNAAENNASFLKRIYIYQKERFPIFGHGLLVASFSFSAISYSRICRGVDGFVDGKTYLVGIFTTISLFMLVRIFDEFKDAEEDAKFRKNLPVPRGLISLKELKHLGVLLAIAQIGINLFFFSKNVNLLFYNNRLSFSYGQGIFCCRMAQEKSILVCCFTYVYYSAY
jgi:4-hydroxybenzoate polyprenyltransferase